MSDLTLTQQHFSTAIKGLIEDAQSLKTLVHKPTKGQLTELLVSRLIEKLLTSQFEIGTGIIVNQKGEQSKQMDIIIYDNTILPPLIKEQSLGIYLAESVLGVIEVKYSLSGSFLREADDAATDLQNRIYRKEANYYGDLNEYRPFSSVFGFFGDEIKDLKDLDLGKRWFEEKIKTLISICHPGVYSWIHMADGWVGKLDDEGTNQETTRYFAVMLDNIRTMANMRKQKDIKYHSDWLGQYLRKQD